ncbi:MAG: AAA family ATPase [Bacteriodetes bacterium]|nr:AAA family ATPase [Bacteroidota bacterium]
MLNLAKTTYLYEQIQRVNGNLSTTSTKKACAEIRGLLRELYTFLTEDELQFFTSLYGKQMYVCDKFNVPNDVALQLNKVRIITSPRYKERELLTTDDVTASLYIIEKVIASISGIAPVVPLLQQSLPIRFTTNVFSESSEILHLVRGIIKGIGTLEEIEFNNNARKHCAIEIESDELGLLTIHLWDDHTQQATHFWIGAALHVFEVKRSKGREQQYSTTKDSLLVLEPDVLLDVTSVAECFQNNTYEPLLYFIQKFTKSTTSKAMVVGSIINYALDEYLSNPDIEFEVMFNNALRIKPLTSLVGLSGETQVIDEVKKGVREQVERLQTILEELTYDKLSTEPSFISPLYGLQGRLDVLLEFDSSPYRKTVIELKSGSAPQPSYGYSTNNNATIISSGMWTNHLAQVTGYNLLLDSAFPQRTGDSQVLYSKTSVFPLRNAPNIHSLKQSVLAVRNAIVFYEHQLTERKFGFLQQLHPQKIAMPTFKVQDALAFSALYSKLTVQERLYVQAFISFLQREQIAQRVGSDVSNGYAALWLESQQEKEERFAVLSGLVLDETQSDFNTLHLRFTFSEFTQENSVFRIGDIAIVYPDVHDEEDEVYHGQIIKCSVREITETHVCVSVRNKQLHKDIFYSSEHWCIEPDYVETSYNNIYSSLFDVFELPEQEKSIRLGLSEPRKTSSIHEFDSSVTPEQQILLNKALSANDYFLLQGPPGTGKTSVMLKNLVAKLYNTQDECILLTAFTNRAVDEICSSIKRIIQGIEFIRLGSKENTIHHDVLLQTIAEKNEFSTLQDTISSCRVFVGTLSYLHTNPELFALKKFTTAIVDEASQILEPMLVGLLANVKRFILIGDEKQLPAVVTQKERGCKVQHEHLDALGINDLRTSYFERLLRICQQQNWTDSFGMLSKQGRMHKEIQEYCNIEYYNNKLTPLNQWQVLSFDETAFDKRMIFIPTEKESGRKFHSQEAALCARLATMLANRLGDSFTNQSIGIITPFRAQIREISIALPNDIRPLISIDTVERYQGSERDIIIISCAVNHVSQLQSVQSLADFDGVIVDRKLNVALTRARQQCIILGVEEVLEQSLQYCKLINHIKSNDGYITVQDLEDVL